MLRMFLLLIEIILVSAQCMQQQVKTDEEFARLRHNAFERQIVDRGITDKKVIEAMMKVERHKFVPHDLQQDAYDDSPLPIGEGQTISQPYVVAVMTELLHLKPTDRILEIGTGSGYQAAILAEICREVYSIEVIQSLGERAAQLLKKMEYSNVYIKIGDGYQGWAEHAPFDGIIVTCAPTDVPEPLKLQLAEGGRMVIPVGERHNQELVVLTKHNGKLRKEYVFPVLFVPMVDTDGHAY